MSKNEALATIIGLTAVVLAMIWILLPPFSNKGAKDKE